MRRRPPTRAARRRRRLSASGRVVLVRGVRLGRGGHGGRADEPRNVVDVAVGVVAGDAAPQPDDGADAEPGLEGPLDVLPVHARVSRLHHRVEQALLGRQRGPGPVDVQAPALQDHRPTPPLRPRHDAPHASRRGDATRQTVVAGPVAVLGPAVEAPIHKGHLGGRFRGRGAPDERAARVAHPASVGRKPVRSQPPRIDPRLLQPPQGPSFRAGVPEHDLDRLDGREPAHDLDVAPSGRLELAGPIGPVVGPRQPGGAVGLPLRRHEVAVALEPGGRRRPRGSSAVQMSWSTTFRRSVSARNGRTPNGFPSRPQSTVLPPGQRRQPRPSSPSAPIAAQPTLPGVCTVYGADSWPGGRRLRSGKTLTRFQSPSAPIAAQPTLPGVCTVYGADLWRSSAPTSPRSGSNPCRTALPSSSRAVRPA